MPKIEIYEDILVMIEDLKNKKIEGVFISLPIASNIMKENEGLFTVLDTIKSNMQFGIVFRNGNPLREDVNNALKEIVEDGTYKTIYDEWFIIKK